jgi:hypothetical protein
METSRPIIYIVIVVDTVYSFRSSPIIEERVDQPSD